MMFANILSVGWPNSRYHARSTSPSDCPERQQAKSRSICCDSRASEATPYRRMAPNRRVQSGHAAPQSCREATTPAPRRIRNSYVECSIKVARRAVASFNVYAHALLWWPDLALLGPPSRSAFAPLSREADIELADHQALFTLVS